MIFGDPNAIAIEIGEILPNYHNSGACYIQFRFIVKGEGVGDWEDRIQLTAAVGYMMDFLANKPFRRQDSLSDVSASEFFFATYDVFYTQLNEAFVSPNLRDRHHLSDAGAGALLDKIGISVADISDGSARIVVKDFKLEQVIFDLIILSQLIDEMGNSFVNWAEGLTDSAGNAYLKPLHEWRRKLKSQRERIMKKPGQLRFL